MDNGKKIGILTFVNADNFGAVLQAYALSRYCSELQYDVEFINYRINSPQNNVADTVRHRERIFQKIIRRLKITKNHHRNVQIRKFTDFRTTLLSISRISYNGDLEFLEKYPDDYDIVICGSDQIWNTQLSNNSKTFYLDFKCRAKKIAYAGSYGHEVLTSTERRYTERYISLMDAVSCREKESIDEMKKLCPNKDIEWVVDPVFLLKREQWNKIVKVPRDRNYIFVYTMEDSIGMEEAIESIRKQYPDRKIVSVVGGCCGNPPNTSAKKEVGPKEFVGFIAGADAVITNSFHAAAFCIIYAKPLCLVEHSIRNLRLKNLMMISGIDMGKIVPRDGGCMPVKLVDTNKALENMQKNIVVSKEFLKNTLI